MPTVKTRGGGDMIEAIWQSDLSLIVGVMLGLAATAVAILRDTALRSRQGSATS